MSEPAASGREADDDTLLIVDHLKKHFPIKRGLLRSIVGWVPAVDGISLTLRSGATLGLVGESGCGKTTAIRTMMRIYEPTDGTVRFRLEDDLVDVTRFDSSDLKLVWRKMRMIFQDPDSSLNPRIPIRDIIAEPLVLNRIATSRADIDRRVRHLMETVGLNPDHVLRYPHAFSGGQRQRIGVARALALEPKIIFADEPTSALDVSVQAQILNLLLDIQEERGLAYLFVSHNLSVVKHISDRLAVMYLGELVEVGSTQDVFREPLHPYTKALLSAIPEPDPHRHTRPIQLEGEIPDPAHRPAGCPFHPRCPLREPICRTTIPPLRNLPGSSRQVACHVVMKNLTGDYGLDDDPQPGGR